MDVVEAKKHVKNGVETSGILFQANIHRDLPATNQQNRLAIGSNILASWKEDLSDFDALVAKFAFRNIDS